MVARMQTRRAFLLGSAGALVAAGTAGTALYGERARRHFLPDRGAAPDAVAATGARISTGTLASAHVPGPVAWAASIPGGGVDPGSLDLCFVLPGRGATAGHVLGAMRYADLAALAGARPGNRPFALVAADGGSSYWHRRTTGEDRLAFLLEDVRAHLREHLGIGSTSSRLALHGFSMGGAGCLRAAELHPATYRAVAVASPALWSSAGATPAGAYDSAADFAAADPLRRAGRLDGARVRVDCGRDDPFAGTTRDLLRRLPRASGGLSAGRHEERYWMRVAPAQFAFVARGLAA
jgi:S-formylglutathione hydrolase FrmB